MRIAACETLHHIDIAIAFSHFLHAGIERGILNPAATCCILYPCGRIAIGRDARHFCIDQLHFSIGTGFQCVESCDVIALSVHDSRQGCRCVILSEKCHDSLGEIAGSSLGETNTFGVTRPSHSLNFTCRCREIVDVAIAGCSEINLCNGKTFRSVEGQRGVLLVGHEALTAIAINIDARRSRTSSNLQGSVIDHKGLIVDVALHVGHCLTDSITEVGIREVEGNLGRLGSRTSSEGHFINAYCNLSTFTNDSTFCVFHLSLRIPSANSHLTSRNSYFARNLTVILSITLSIVFGLSAINIEVTLGVIVTSR